MSRHLQRCADTDILASANGQYSVLPCSVLCSVTDQKTSVGKQWVMLRVTQIRAVSRKWKSTFTKHAHCATDDLKRMACLSMTANSTKIHVTLFLSKQLHMVIPHITK